MTISLIQKVAAELSVKPAQVASVIQLLFEQECTIPFVARYRKEMTGSLDEVQLRQVRDRYHFLVELESTKTKYLRVVEEHCLKNPAWHGQFEALRKRFEACTTRQELEDLYLPFKPKRRTRAMIAREQGLEPLLEQILERRATASDLLAMAAAFITPADKKDVPAELRVETREQALAGAADIYAERINETADLRTLARRICLETGQLVARKIETKDDAKPAPGAGDAKVAAAPAKAAGSKKSDASKYQNYFDYREPLKSAPAHRIMAVRRGESEKALRVSIEVDEGRCLAELSSHVLGATVATDAVKAWLSATLADAWRRLMAPSLETELRLMLKTQAEDEAINVFAKNLESLLLLPPLPGRVVLGVDPGLRTGAKLAVVDGTGKLLASATIYPDYRKDEAPKTKEAKETVLNLIKQYSVQCIAVGNGTGSREIDRFITTAIKDAGIKDTRRVIVNEAGASVYSTDEIAREEFPGLDPTLRSAVSIARRLQDPLAELVKINPRSIGVGQYQHDVNPAKLNRSLEEVVESCVNKVGVNLNTASHKLLAYVSGVGPTLAKNIIAYRNNHGPFDSRAAFGRVSGVGPKVFQQAAGFLRVPESANPLDNSAVHPERYDIVEMIATDLKQPVAAIVGKSDVVARIPWEKYVSQSIGMPTLQDIGQELLKPGRDPREDGARLTFSDDVTTLEDLKPGMVLHGTVTNVTNFGAFVDIGVHQDGLVHVSELSEKFIKDPSEVVAVGTVLSVRVIDVDMARRRISLSCRPPAAERPPREPRPAPRQDQGPPRPAGERSPAADQSRHDTRPPRGDRGGDRPGRSQDSGRPRPAGRPRQPEKHFTLDDLMNKFGRKGS